MSENRGDGGLVLVMILCILGSVALINMVMGGCS